MEVKLDEQDFEILKLLQKDCKISAKHIARKIDSLTTTVYAKIKRMEKLGIIKEYNAILDGKKLDKGVTAFSLISFAYRASRAEGVLSQEDIAEKISRFPEVQGVHIVAGEWDILVKIRSRDVESVGKFVVDHLRKVAGVDKVLTLMSFYTIKESLGLDI